MKKSMNGTDKEKTAELQNKGWLLEKNRLIKVFEFENFSKINRFLPKIVDVIVAKNHHPELHFSPENKSVRVMLTTHDQGNKVTEKDCLLALSFEKIYEEI